MFTGITRGTFPVVRLEREPTLLTYTVELEEALARGLSLGASVAIDGVCQTAAHIDGNRVTFQAIPETLSRTTLGSLSEGDRVSVERSARVGDEIGGHDVSGHVVGTGVVVAIRADGGRYDVVVEVPSAWCKYLAPKGFIAIDGSSLTLGDVDRAKGRFVLHLVPETLRLTNLGKKREGDRVNVELDSRTRTIVDTVERVLDERAASEHGGNAQR